MHLVLVCLIRSLKTGHFVLNLIKYSIGCKQTVFIVEDGVRCHVVKNTRVYVIFSNPFFLDDSVHHSAI